MNASPVCFAPDVRANLGVGGSAQWELPARAEISNVLWPRALIGSWGHIATWHVMTLILSRDKESRESGMKLCVCVCVCVYIYIRIRADCDHADDADNAV
jgi:hypothetical protein